MNSSRINGAVSGRAGHREFFCVIVLLLAESSYGKQPAPGNTMTCMTVSDVINHLHGGFSLRAADLWPGLALLALSS